LKKKSQVCIHPGLILEGLNKKEHNLEEKKNISSSEEIVDGSLVYTFFLKAVSFWNKYPNKIFIECEKPTLPKYGIELGLSVHNYFFQNFVRIIEKRRF
jgi:hypothetical protein